MAKFAMQKWLKSNGVFAGNKVSHSAGFTLIELMVVVAIMAILTMVAYPGYQESIRKSRRADAIAAALTLQAAQEKFRANCAVYASAIDTVAPLLDACIVGPPNTSVLVADTDSPEDLYTMSFSGATGNTYVITATAKGAQLADTACLTMTITFNPSNPNGAKAPASCWP